MSIFKLSTPVKTAVAKEHHRGLYSLSDSNAIARDLDKHAYLSATALESIGTLMKLSDSISNKSLDPTSAKFTMI